MSAIKVCLSPKLIDLFDLSGSNVVVIDILRATSCITTALAMGIKSVKPISNLEECLEYNKKGYITAGERNGHKVDGFDLGNSPFGFMKEQLKGKKIAFTTTNGTLAINLSKSADQVFIGSFLNIEALGKVLVESGKPIILFCAGWKGMVNLEDTLFAGALAESLADKFDVKEDATLASIYLYQKAKNDLFGFLQNSSHFNRLKKLNIVDDIKFCLNLSKYDVVPLLYNDELIPLKK